MNTHLSRQSYAELQRQVIGGTAHVIVAPAIARRFFTHTSLAEIQRLVEPPVRWQKSIILAGRIIAPLIFVGCLLTVARQTGLLALLLIPLISILWTIIAGLSNPEGTWPAATAGLGATFLLMPFLSLTLGATLVTFSTSLWLHRMTYRLAPRLLIDIVISSYDAFDELTPHLSVAPTTWLDDTASDGSPRDLHV